MTDKPKKTRNLTGKQTTFMLTTAESLALKQLAVELGYRSTSALLRAIAAREGVKVIRTESDQ